MDIMEIIISFVPIFIIVLGIFAAIRNIKEYFDKVKIKKRGEENLLKAFNDEEVIILEANANNVDFNTLIEDSAKPDSNIFTDKSEKKYVLSVWFNGIFSYLSIDKEKRKFALLINPASELNKIIEIPFDKCNIIQLGQDSFSVLKGGGSRSKTYYYNRYYVQININNIENSNTTNTDWIKPDKNELILYRSKTEVFKDKGVEELKARRLAENFSKMLNISLERLSGDVNKPEELDENIFQKYFNFKKPVIKTDKEYFRTKSKIDGYTIYQLIYFKANLFLVLLIITIVSEIFLFKRAVDVEFNLFSFIIKDFSTSGLIIINIITFVLMLIALIIIYSKICTPIRPIEKVLIILSNKQLIYKPKLDENHRILSSHASIPLDEIEEIRCRKEIKLGFVLKIVSDKKVIKVYNSFNRNIVLKLMYEIIEKILLMDGLKIPVKPPSDFSFFSRNR